MFFIYQLWLPNNECSASYYTSTSMRNKLHQKPDCATERKPQGADTHRVLRFLSLDFCFWQKGRAGTPLAPWGRFVDEYLCHPGVLCTSCFLHPLDVVFLLLLLSSHRLTAELQQSWVPQELEQESTDNNTFGITF